jgi:hypothetical protein
MPGVRPGIDDVSADLMPERQRQIVLGTHPVVEIAEIGMTDAASCDLDQDFVRTGGEITELDLNQGFAPARHHPANRFCAHARPSWIDRPPLGSGRKVASHGRILGPGARRIP